MNLFMNSRCKVLSGLLVVEPVNLANGSSPIIDVSKTESFNIFFNSTVSLILENIIEVSIG